MSQSDYKVRIGITWVDETSPPAKKAKKGLDEVAKAAKAMFGAAMIRQGVKFATELVKIGAAADRQANALNNLAAAAGTSGDAIVKAIQSASDYTIDQMTAMGAASRAMVMDVADSPAEFERLTKVATALGRAMGQDAAKSIDDFVTAAGRQSKLIADNLGLVINAEDAYLRFAEANNIAVDEMDDAAKKQAFLTEMLRQGEIKMQDLGDQSLDTAGQIEQATAAWKDIRMELGRGAAEIVASTGALTRMAEKLRFESQIRELESLGVGSRAMRMEAFDLAKAWGDASKANEVYVNMLRIATGESISAAEGHQYLRGNIERETEAIESSSPAVEWNAEKRNEMLFAMHQTNRAQEELASTTPPVTSALVEESEAAKEAKDALLKLNESTIDIAQTNLATASSYTDYQKGIEESAADFAKRREKIEEDHADKVAKIWQRGQARAIKFDEEAQRQKIKRMREDLDVTIKSQGEMTDKTKGSTRDRMELRIERAQEGLAKEEQLLDTYLAGRLVKEGANVNALMAEEDRRYSESLLSLEEAQAEQEASQKESLGRMVLQHFNAWVSMTLAADGFTKQEVKYITETRMQISEQYGLVTQAAIGEMEAQELEWKRTMAIMTGDAENFFDFFMQQFDALPSEKVMRIRTELSEAPTDIARQRGGPVRAGNPYIVGESGPELFVPGSSGRVVSNSQAFDSHDTYNFNTPHGPIVALEAQRRQRRQRMGRVM